MEGKNKSSGNEFLIRKYRGQKEVAQHFSCAERKGLSPIILYAMKISFRIEGKSRFSQMKENYQSWVILKEYLKEAL